MRRASRSRLQFAVLQHAWTQPESVLSYAVLCCAMFSAGQRTCSGCARCILIQDKCRETNHTVLVLANLISGEHRFGNNITAFCQFVHSNQVFFRCRFILLYYSTPAVTRRCRLPTLRTTARAEPSLDRFCYGFCFDSAFDLDVFSG